jgi:hypothetical protein
MNRGRLTEARRRVVLKCHFLISVVSLGVLVACSSDSGNVNKSGPIPQTVAQGNFSIDAPGPDHVHFWAVNVTNSVSGSWQATVDWTYPTNELWMYVSAGICTADQFALPECPDQAACPCTFTVRSEVATPKPRVLNIAGSASGTRTVFILNWGPREDGGVYSVMLTPTSSITGLGGAEYMGGIHTSVFSGMKSPADFHR